MAVSSKDIELLWERYRLEAVPAGISVNQFFESNGVPYHVFEKWYKRKHQSPKVVSCVVEGNPDPLPSTPSTVTVDAPTVPTVCPQSTDSVVVKDVNLCFVNGMKIEHHDLSYSGLQVFIQKLQALCLA